MVKKSPNDYRKYRIVNLKNGIKGLVISDIDARREDEETYDSIETKLAAAAFCINVGSFDDPIQIPGLAHFLEHMVFMGSKKYSGENDFDSFLKLHGGSMNAFTEFEFTNFHFSVQPEYFEESLDRFAQFFISPLLREDAVQRELKAVDSEFKGVLQEDVCRIEQVLAHSSRKCHPFSKFTWGNKYSLSTHPKKNDVDVMKFLREFFQFYLNRQATVCLCATESLDNLEEMVKKYFSDLPYRDFNHLPTRKQVFENPFDVSDSRKLFYVLPVKDYHLLRLQWVIPSQYKHYRTHPERYLSFLLGHRGEGSVYSYLLKRGYISSIYCISDSNSTFGFFGLTMELTDEGINNAKEVIRVVFQYLRILNEAEPSKRIHDEMQKIDFNSFRFLEPEDPESYVEDLVADLHLAEDDIITKGFYMHEYVPQQIKELLSFLSLESVYIIISSKNFQHLSDNEEEPWFKTSFSREEIPEEWIDVDKCTKENKELHLPIENQFIAENFEINEPKDKKQLYPEKIIDTPHHRVWFKQDSKFLLPKGMLMVMEEVNFGRIDATHHAKPRRRFLVVREFMTCVTLFEQLFYIIASGLDHETSLADMDQYSYHVVSEKARYLTVTGYSDKLLVVFQKHVDMLLNFKFTEKHFNIAKESIRRKLRNYLIVASSLMHKIKDLVLSKYMSDYIEILNRLESISIPSFQEFRTKYLKEMYIEALFQGNLLQEDVDSYLEYMGKTWEYKPMLRDAVPKSQSLKLPKGRTLCRHQGFNTNDPNTVVYNYYQIGKINMTLLTYGLMLQHIISEPVFDYLRTKKQLGYSVYSDHENSEGVLSFGIFVETQVGKFSADEVDMLIEEFLLYFEQKLKDFTKDEFNKYVTSFVKGCKQADLSISEEVERHWNTITNGEYLFDLRTKKIEYAEKMTKEDLLEYYQTYILDKENQRMISFQVIGHNVENKEENSSSSEDSDSESSDSASSVSEGSHDDDTSNCFSAPKNLVIKNLDFISLDSVTNKEQYTRCITDLHKFKEEAGYYPNTKLTY